MGVTNAKMLNTDIHNTLNPKHFNGFIVCGLFPSCAINWSKFGHLKILTASDN